MKASFFELLAVASIFLVSFGGLIYFPYPFWARCSVICTFSLPCSSVKEALIEQVKLWSDDKSCTRLGRKCLYMLTNKGHGTVKVSKTKPHRGASCCSEDISLNFNDIYPTNCTVKGFSASRAVFKVFDNGDNYCNIMNLFNGALEPEYIKACRTDDSHCTQYSQAQCTF